MPTICAPPIEDAVVVFPTTTPQIHDSEKVLLAKLLSQAGSGAGSTETNTHLTDILAELRDDVASRSLWLRADGVTIIERVVSQDTQVISWRNPVTGAAVAIGAEVPTPIPAQTLVPVITTTVWANATNGPFDAGLSYRRISMSDGQVRWYSNTGLLMSPASGEILGAQLTAVLLFTGTTYLSLGIQGDINHVINKNAGRRSFTLVNIGIAPVFLWIGDNGSLPPSLLEITEAGFILGTGVSMSWTSEDCNMAKTELYALCESADYNLSVVEL